MSFDEQVRVHQRRCQPHLARLLVLAHGEAGAPLPSQAAAEVREAANAVITEAEEASRAALAAVAGTYRQPEAETFLWARLARLARAADEAVSAARGTDVHGLRSHLDHFDALTAAIWAVQDAVVQVPRHRAPASTTAAS